MATSKLESPPGSITELPQEIRSSYGPARAAIGELLGLFWIFTMLWLALWAVAPALLLGWESVVITSGSMQPTLDPGDVVVASPPSHDIGAGTIIVFEDGPDRITTHRVTAVNPDGAFVTRGDANGRDDSSPVPRDSVIGVGRLLVPAAGLPLFWAWSGSWAELATLAAVTVAALWLARDGNGLHTKSDETKNGP